MLNNRDAKKTVLGKRKKRTPDQMEVWVGQCWVVKENQNLPNWPEFLIVVQQGKGFVPGTLLTIVTRPTHKLGCFFPIHSDALKSHYTMEYDHTTGLGRLESELTDYRNALKAIETSTTSSVKMLQELVKQTLDRYRDDNGT